MLEIVMSAGIPVHIHIVADSAAFVIVFDVVAGGLLLLLLFMLCR